MTSGSILELLQELVSDEKEAQILKLVSEGSDNEIIIETILRIGEKDD